MCCNSHMKVLQCSRWTFQKHILPHHGSFSPIEAIQELWIAGKRSQKDVFVFFKPMNLFPKNNSSTFHGKLHIWNLRPPAIKPDPLCHDNQCPTTSESDMFPLCRTPQEKYAIPYTKMLICKIAQMFPCKAIYYKYCLSGNIKLRLIGWFPYQITINWI